MSGGFNNQIVGGAETLVRTGIRSVDYAAGVSGWRIARDGTAEFNSGTFRGNVTVGVAPDGQILLDDSVPTLLALAYSGTVSAVSLRMLPGDGSYHYIVTGLQGDGSTFMAMGIVPAGATLVSQICQTYYQFFLNTTDVAQTEIGDTTHDYRVLLNANFVEIGNGLRGDLAVDGQLSVDGVAQFADDVTVAGAGTLLANGPAQFKGSLLIGAGITALAQSPLEWSSNGTSADGWTNLTYAAGWATLGGGTALAFKKVAAPGDGLWITGSMVPGTKANGTTLATLPVGFRPAHSWSLPITCDVQAAGQSPHFGIDTAGVITCWGVATATQCTVSGIIPLTR